MGLKLWKGDDNMARVLLNVYQQRMGKETREAWIIPTNPDEAYLMDALPWRNPIPEELHPENPKWGGLVSWVSPYADEERVHLQMLDHAESIAKMREDGVVELDEQRIEYQYKER